MTVELRSLDGTATIMCGEKRAAALIASGQYVRAESKELVEGRNLTATEIKRRMGES